jgi:hypothetical protein
MAEDAPFATLVIQVILTPALLGNLNREAPVVLTTGYRTYVRAKAALWKIKVIFLESFLSSTDKKRQLLHLNKPYLRELSTHLHNNSLFVLPIVVFKN